jgi:hypothetical protein
MHVNTYLSIEWKFFEPYEASCSGPFSAYFEPILVTCRLAPGFRPLFGLRPAPPEEVDSAQTPT